MLKGKNGELITSIDNHLVKLKNDAKSVYYSLLKTTFDVKSESKLPSWIKWVGIIISIILVIFIIGNIILRNQVNQKTRQLTKKNAELEKEITDHKQARESLIKSKLALSEAQSLAKIGSWEWIAESDTLIWSDQMFSIMGLEAKKEPPSRENQAKLHHPDDIEFVFKNMENAFLNKTSDKFEARLLSPNGSPKLVNINIRPVIDSTGNTTGLFGIYQDITERKKAEEQIKASLKEKEILLQEIHHRVKNNMAVIASLLTLQMHKTDDDRIKGPLQESRNRVYAMSAVHETLYGSDNLSEILIEPFMRKIVEYVFQSYQINPDQVRIKTEFDAIKLNIDKASPLGLVTNELVSNAFKYAFPDGRDGEITLSIKKLNNENVEITIKDNGIGMPKDMNWDNPKGLGLKLVKNIVENQLNGSLNLESVAGTQFVIRFNTQLT